MNGMNPDPCNSYALKDRFVCDHCGHAPHLSKADTTPEGKLQITLECHGAKITQSFSRQDLVFTQHVFKKDE